MKTPSFVLHLAFALLLCVLAGCASPPREKNSLELQAIQSREFECEKKTAFAAVLSVFQDMGYVIASAEINTGFITAKSPTTGQRVLFVGNVMEDVRATAFVEDTADGKSRVRLNFVGSKRASSRKGRVKENEVALDDPMTYTKTFEKIGESVFIRKSTK